MIKIKKLIDLLKKNKSDFFTGVPDSILKELSYSLQSKNYRSASGINSKASRYSLLSRCLW